MVKGTRNLTQRCVNGHIACTLTQSFSDGGRLAALHLYGSQNKEDVKVKSLGRAIQFAFVRRISYYYLSYALKR